MEEKRLYTLIKEYHSQDKIPENIQSILKNSFKTEITLYEIQEIIRKLAYKNDPKKLQIPVSKKRGWKKKIKNMAKHFISVLLVIIAVGGVLAGGIYFLNTLVTNPSLQHPHMHKHNSKIWTCSMHPQIRLNEPGLCPICNMKLVPLQKNDSSEISLKISETAKKLANIETAKVKRQFVRGKIRLVGKVYYNETKVSYITAWIPGRIDKLFVDYTGIEVKKGDHMAKFYSPDLYSAQQELLQSIQSVKEMTKSNLSLIKESAKATIRATREKLRLLGLSLEQIKNIEKAGKPSFYTTIYAPASGIVVEKEAFEGMYVKTGTKIYKIADLNTVWVKLDAYESDLKWIRYGQKVIFETEAYPGKTFEGRIAFIDPVLHSHTRTVKVRINVDNRNGLLKPEMFLHAVIEPVLTAKGKILNQELKGKWICAMHPSVIKAKPGFCDICKMPLVSTESIGYSKSQEDAAPPLVIPISAPLITGKKAVVYVELPNKEKPTYQLREIVLGPKAGNYYIVKEGLKQGERVVTRGNFKIDSELQIQAKKSMMSMPSETITEEQKKHSHKNMGKAKFYKIVDVYFALDNALVKSDVKAAFKQLQKLKETIHNTQIMSPEWTYYKKQLQHILHKFSKEDNLNKVRENFAVLSEVMINSTKNFGYKNKVAYRMHCPMAFDNRGADWMQKDDNIRNPYFGNAMLKCGKVVEKIKGDENE